MARTPGRWLTSGLAVLAAGSGALAGSATGRRSAVATSCPHPRVPVPRHEPRYRSGPTELVSGLFIQGGPAPPPHCPVEPRGPYAGKVTVTTRGGKVVASQTAGDGRLAHIPLEPGKYRASGRFASGGFTIPVDFTVKPGTKTRQDTFEDVP